MATVTLDAVNKIYDNGFQAIYDLSLDIADSEFLVLVGPSGCGKSTALRMVAGSGVDHQRRAADRRPGRQRCRAQGPRHRDGLPELCAVPPHDGVRQHRLRPQAGPGSQAGDRQPGAQGGGDPRARAVPLPQARAALGRPAPAGGDGPGDRAPAGGVPHGRAAVQPRRQAARPDAGRDRPPPTRPRGDHDLRHPRPGRGDDDGRPGRRAQGRLPAAGRRAAAPLRRTDQRVRRRVHRVAVDEPVRGCRDARRRQERADRLPAGGARSRDVGEAPGAAELRRPARGGRHPPRGLRGRRRRHQRSARSPPEGHGAPRRGARVRADGPPRDRRRQAGQLR